MTRGVIAALLLGGAAAGLWRGRQLEEDLRRQLQADASALARAINPQEAAALSFTAADRDRPVFRRLGDQFAAYAGAFGHRCIWTVAVRDGVLVNGPESLADADPLASPPGTPYRNPPPELRGVFTDGRARIVGPYRDEDGTFVTAFAPVAHPRTGEIFMAVAVDVEADRWRAKVFRGSLEPAGFAVVLVLMTAIGGRLMRRHRRAEVWLTVACGTILSVGVAGLVHESEMRLRQRTFDQVAGAQQGFLADTLRDIQTFQLSSLARFFEGSEHVTREEFHVFAGPLAATATAQAWQWAPRVTASQRAEFELAQRAVGYDSFTIRELGPDGRLRPAGDRTEYFPVLFTEPATGNEPALGFDLASEPSRAAALRAAARSGLITATNPVSLVQDNRGQPSILVVCPVGSPNAWNVAVPMGEGERGGFVVAVLRLGATLHEALVHNWHDEAATNVALVQLTNLASPEVLAVHPPEAPLADRPAEEILRLAAGRLAAAFPLFVFGQAYGEVILPGAGFLAANPARGGAAALLIGLLLTIILATFAGFIGSRREELESEVASRTALLRSSEERYRQLFLSHPLPMWVYDLESLTFLAVNRAAVAKYGWSMEEFLKMSLRDIRPPEEIGRLEESVSRSRRRPGFEHSSGWRHRTRSGQILNVEISSHDLVYDGRRARVVVAQDVTDRARLEEQLRHAQKLEAVGRLAGGIAHDFNNLLQALLAAAQAARMQTSEPGLAAILDEVQGHVRRGATLARQLLLFARREPLRRGHRDLSSLVTEHMAMLRRLVPETIELQAELAAEPVVVEMDSGQVGQVLTNLVVNARDAMPLGGQLSVRTGRIGPEVFLEVSDTGVGMSRDVRAHLFEPFFTTKGRGEGSGLGLAVVHGIVMSHGGRVDVETELGRGSRFRVWLPASPADAADASETLHLEAEIPRGKGERILLAEDEEGARRGLAEVLRLLGYHVTDVSSGEEALALPVEPGFDILLTDIMLPGSSGLDVAGTLAARWPGLAVVLMSGYTADEEIRETLSEEAVRFLEKPFDMATLARELRAAVGEEM